jgi:tRNA A-37 threonylcarbamoyl transferase component Bud32
MPGRRSERGHSQREALAPGTRLENFEIVRALGSGGFGKVYLAHDHQLEREVAIKEYLPLQLAYRAEGLRVAVRSPELAATYAAGLRSFVNEARILARFDHPAVVKVHRFWEANGTAYMVMPWVRGPTLSEMRRRMTRAPTEAWLRGVIDPLLDALAMLHAQGIYHRDIAPDNVLLPGEQAPVLLDFGAARRVIGDRTQSFTSVLKPSFAPIEQYAQARGLRQGPWTDLYALGALCVYLLTAMPPPPAAARAVHDELDRRLLPAPAGVSHNLLAVIRWALEVRPHDRPQSVQEFRAALDGLIAVPPRQPGPAVVPEAAGAPWPVDPAEEAVSEGVTGDVLPPSLPPPAPVTGFDAAGAAACARAWEPTLRLGLPTPAVPRLQGPPPASRTTWFASIAAVAVAAAGTVIFLARGPADPGAATWRALAEQAAAQAVTESLDPPPGDDAPVSGHVAQGVQQALGRAAPVLRTLVGTPAADPLTPPAPSRPLSAAASSRAVDGTAHGAAPKRKPASLARAKALPGPREACASRNVFRMAACIERRCGSARMQRHPQCVELRRPPEFSWLQHEQT